MNIFNNMHGWALYDFTENTPQNAWGRRAVHSTAKRSSAREYTPRISPKRCKQDVHSKEKYLADTLRLMKDVLHFKGLFLTLEQAHKYCVPVSFIRKYIKIVSNRETFKKYKGRISLDTYRNMHGWAVYDFTEKTPQNVWGRAIR